MSESGGRSLVLRAGDSGLVHDRRRPPHLADSPATPSAEVGRFEAAPGEGPRSKPVQVLGSGIGYPVPAGLPSSVPVEAALGTRGTRSTPVGWCRTLDSTLVALRLSRIRTAALFTARAP